MLVWKLLTWCFPRMKWFLHFSETHWDTLSFHTNVTLSFLLKYRFCRGAFSGQPIELVLLSNTLGTSPRFTSLSNYHFLTCYMFFFFAWISFFLLVYKFQENREFISFVHCCYIPGVWNSAWHIISAYLIMICYMCQ